MFVPILHADADCFFASVEQRDQPRLRGRPTMVATWVVMAASYEARAFGIHSAMHATEARRLCPDVIAVEPRSEAYAEASAALFSVFEAASPTVEPHGLEEAFLTGPPSLGERLRADVRREVGLPITVGVASTKIAAKMASRAAKPDGLRIVDDERAFLHAHRVEQLWGIGKATAARLHARGIATVGEAAVLAEPELIALLGTGNGRRVHALVNNRDREPVHTARPRRAFGSSRSLARGDHPPTVLSQSAERVAERLRAAGVAGRTVTLHLRFSDHTTATRSRTLPAAVDDATVIAATAAALVDSGRALTRIGVSVTNLEAAERLRLWL